MPRETDVVRILCALIATACLSLVMDVAAANDGPCESPDLKSLRSDYERTHNRLARQADAYRRVGAGFQQNATLSELDNLQRTYREQSRYLQARQAALMFGWAGKSECFSLLFAEISSLNFSIQEIRAETAQDNRYNIFVNGRMTHENLSRVDALMHAAKPFLDVLYPRQKVAGWIIQASISNYADPCPCPYSTDSNGELCGERSAYDLSGGKDPQCFLNDVSNEEIFRLQNQSLIRNHVPGH